MEWMWCFIAKMICGIDTSGLAGCLTTVSALFVPVAVLIYQDFKEKHAFNEFEWDKTAFLQKVIKGRQILAAVLAGSFAIVFWNYKNFWFKLFLFAIFVASIMVLVINLIHIFKWFMSGRIGAESQNDYKQGQKIKFLNELDPNSSLSVWSDLFSSIELENVYLKDYLEIFFKKFAEADNRHCWQYEFCLTQNMTRLYYWGSDFQNAVIDFAFDAYMDEDKLENDIVYCKREVVRELIKLLMKGEDRHRFLISRIFDRKLADIKSSDVVFKAVESFSMDVLQEISSVYNDISERNSHFNSRIFPLNRWNISLIPSSQDERANAKARGLFMAYLRVFPMFVDVREGCADYEKAAFLDGVVFGRFDQGISVVMVRIINLYFFNQNILMPYENEGLRHASVRNFIDKDYQLLFADTGISVSGSFDPNEPEIQKMERLGREFRKAERQRDDNTLKLLTSIYGFLLDVKEMKEIRRAIADYDLKDEKYQYQVDMEKVEYNLSKLKEVIEKVIKFGNKVKKEKQA